MLLLLADDVLIVSCIVVHLVSVDCSFQPNDSNNSKGVYYFVTTH